MTDKRMSDEQIALYARLSFHEFILEILMARSLSPFQESEIDAAAEKVLRLIRTRTYTRDPSDQDSDDGLHLGIKMQEIAEQFMTKAKVRALQMRASGQ